MSVPEPEVVLATRVWLVLVGLTLISFLLGALGHEGIGLAMVVLVIALIKGRLIVDQFMMLRHGAPLWRMLLVGYLLTIGILLAVAFVLAAW